MSDERLSERAWHLLDCLADGKFHSGEDLARDLGIVRTSVFNTMSLIAAQGIEIGRVRGRGYRLARPWQRLDATRIRQAMTVADVAVEILPQATSSNALLLQRAAHGAAHGTVLAVELQTAGRGRLGRRWYAGLGNALTFSLLWRFDCGLNALSGLSLAVGVGVVRALRKLGMPDVCLKWPNDIVTEQGKLGGILIEAQGDMLGPSAVVIGIGLNCALPGDLSRRIDQPAVALEDLTLPVPERNRLLGVLLDELVRVLGEFTAGGFAAVRNEWEGCHLYRDQSVVLRLPSGERVAGVALGVTESGELRIGSVNGIRHLNSGELEVGQ
jgi:BirA family biotin operon repressor/biotin-[acetyl-CoA-carboxylase] ligase